MRERFHNDYAQYKMNAQLKGMNAQLKAEAVRRLKGVLNIWAGIACSRELYNMIQVPITYLLCHR